MNKICVYTCITGNYDDLKEVTKEKGIDYYCFTNNKNIKSKSWNVIYINDDNLSNVKLARKIKILGHEKINKYKILLWMDAAVSFKKKIKDFIDYYMDDKYDFVAFKHGVRSNIKDEAYECVKLDKESKDNVCKILDFYKKENYPDDNGLIESTVFIRKNSKVVNETMQLWFDMILNYSHRDQLSFNYCIYKTGLDVKWINKKVFENEWFSWKKHNSDRLIKKYRLYFGDEDDYNLDCDVQGSYQIDGDVYKINVKIPADSDNLTIVPCHVKSTVLEELKIDGKTFNNFDLRNAVRLENSILFYDENPFIVVYKKLTKNNNINIELKMRVLSDTEEFINVIDKLCVKNFNDNLLINDLKVKLDELGLKLNLIYSGRFWIIKEKIKKIFK